MIFTDQNAPIGYTPHKFKQQQQPKPNACNLVAAREPEVKIILKPIEKHHGANDAMPYRPCAFKVFKHNSPLTPRVELHVCTSSFHIWYLALGYS